MPIRLYPSIEKVVLLATMFWMGVGLFVFAMGVKIVDAVDRADKELDRREMLAQRKQQREQQRQAMTPKLRDMSEDERRAAELKFAWANRPVVNPVDKNSTQVRRRSTFYTRDNEAEE